MCGVQNCIECVNNKCRKCVSGYELIQEYGKAKCITAEEHKSEINLTHNYCHTFLIFQEKD